MFAVSFWRASVCISVFEPWSTHTSTWVCAREKYRQFFSFFFFPLSPFFYLLVSLSLCTRSFLFIRIIRTNGIDAVHLFSRFYSLTLISLTESRPQRLVIIRCVQLYLLITIRNQRYEILSFDSSSGRAVVSRPNSCTIARSRASFAERNID